MVTTRYHRFRGALPGHGASSFDDWSRRQYGTAGKERGEDDGSGGAPQGKCHRERGARPPLAGTIFISSKPPRPISSLPFNWIIDNHLDAHCRRVPTHSEVCRQTTAELHEYTFRYNAPSPRRFLIITLFLSRKKTASKGLPVRTDEAELSEIGAEE